MAKVGTVTRPPSTRSGLPETPISPPQVVRTLLVGDEPRDIVFAGTGGTERLLLDAVARRHLDHPGEPVVLLAHRAGQHVGQLVQVVGINLSRISIFISLWLP